jgi:transposase-like protein
VHANARLTPLGRLTLCLRVAQGRPVAHVAPEMGISRATGYKWWKRFCEEGIEGLVDRSSCPRHCPHRTSSALEAQIAELRRELKLGPARIGSRLGVAPRRCIGSSCASASTASRGWTDRVAG